MTPNDIRCHLNLSVVHVTGRRRPTVDDWKTTWTPKIVCVQTILHAAAIRARTTEHVTKATRQILTSAFAVLSITAKTVNLVSISTAMYTNVCTFFHIMLIANMAKRSYSTKILTGTKWGDCEKYKADQHVRHHLDIFTKIHFCGVVCITSHIALFMFGPLRAFSGRQSYFEELFVGSSLWPDTQLRQYSRKLLETELFASS